MADDENGGSNPDVAGGALERLRKRLLDLSLRNRLLNYPQKSATAVTIVDELPDNVFDLLVNKHKCMTLLPQPEEQKSETNESTKRSAAQPSGKIKGAESPATVAAAPSPPPFASPAPIPVEPNLPSPAPGLGASNPELQKTLEQSVASAMQRIETISQDDQEEKDSLENIELPDLEGDGIGLRQKKYRDDNLQTALPDDRLQARLRRIHNEYHNLIESTGSNFLFLALGFLEWFDDVTDPEKPRIAPVLLIPLTLEKNLVEEEIEVESTTGDLFSSSKGHKKRANRIYRYQVKHSGEEPQSNLVLEMKLREAFSVEMPKYQLEDEQETPERYFEAIRDILALINKRTKRPWRVLRQIRVGFFTFAKDVMYRDLDPTSWENGSLLENPLVNAALIGKDHEAKSIISDDEVEANFSLPEPIPTVLDADSSQMKALIRIGKGENLIVQGPPGTGKSQTITNLIATALAQGKRVLFMAEKLAALEVVRSRLEKVGLSAYCLELHSRRASTAQIHEQIRNRLEHRPADSGSDTKVATALKQVNKNRFSLNAHRKLMAQPIPELGCDIATLYWERDRAVQNFQTVLEGHGKGQRKLSVPLFMLGTTKLLGIEALKRVNQTIEAVGKHWAEAVHQRGRAWVGIKVPRLTQDEADVIVDALSILLAAAKRFAEARSGLSGVPDMDRVEPSHLEMVRRGIESIGMPPETMADCIPKSLAQATTTVAEYETAITNLNLLQEAKSTPVDTLSRAENITDAELNEAIDSIESLHRTSEKTGLCPNETTALIHDAIDANENITALPESIQELHTQIGLGEFLTCMNDVTRATDWLERLMGLPAEVASMLSAALAKPNADRYLQRGLETNREITKLSDHIAEMIALEDAPPDEELKQTRLDLREARNSWLPWWPFGRLANVKRRARQFARGNIPVTDEQFISRLSDLETLYGKKDAFAKDRHLADALGPAFKGVVTDWNALKQAIQLAKEMTDWLKEYSRVQTLLDRLVQIRSKEGEIAGLIKRTRERVEKIQHLIPVGLSLHQEPRHVSFTALQQALHTYIESNQALCSKVQCLGQPGDMTYATLEVLAEGVLRIRIAKKQITEFVQDAHRLGTWYTGPYDTDTSVLSETLNWVKLASATGTSLLGAAFVRWLFEENIGEHYAKSVSALGDLAALAAEWRGAADQFSKLGKVDPNSCFSSNPSPQTFNQVVAGLEEAFAARDVLLRWSDYQYTLGLLRSGHHEQIIDFAEGQQLPGTALNCVAQAAFYHQWLAHIIQKYPQLADFARVEHEIVRTHFSKGDKSLPDHFRALVDEKLFREESQLPQGVSKGYVKDFTDMGLIRNELKKQRMHVPVRQLVRRAGNALISMMPCWMMGPASVAQFLPPNKLEFDLVVMDEASQIRPEDALGALARASQVVIVGDSNQMPPSDVFSSLGTAEQDDETFAAEDLKSILDHADQYYDSERLLWHYRSQHESLIQFSSDRFYDKSLIIPPSVHREHGELGIKWRFCPTATYHAGFNEVEALEVVTCLSQHVLQQAGLPPEEQESIGLVAMNVKQQGLIEELWDKAITTNDELAQAWRKYEPVDKLFIKNLENVQGDERDVIVIGFTYGPDSSTRRVFQRFGPINKDGGWRRLNVLFTRARKRLIAISSMRSTDVIAGANVQRHGSTELRQYLEYAETGRLPDYGAVTGRGPDSPFEESVATIISSLGLDPHFQVGVDGFRIDIGVVNPRNPGMYLCGIECDGATYHRSAVARDRDRLRQEILETRGWTLHRIWSTDWFRNRRSEVERLAKTLTSLADAESSNLV